MSTGIEWSDETWNPTIGCTRVSPGCDHCYASTLHNSRYRSNVKATLDFEGGLSSPAELRGVEELPYPAQYDQPFAKVQMLPERLDIPLRRWKTTPKRIFVDSMADLFHEDVTDEFLISAYAVMVAAYWQTFQVLSKRPERRQSLFNDPAFREQVGNEAAARINSFRGHDPRGSGMSRSLAATHNLAAWNGDSAPNIWEGISAENQEAFDERWEHLRQTPAAVRWISAEPLLGRLNLCGCGPDYQDEACALHGRGPYLDWVVIGGESGAKRRPMQLAWLYDIVDQCLGANVPVFVKQDGAFAPGKQGRIPDSVWALKQFPTETPGGRDD